MNKNMTGACYMVAGLVLILASVSALLVRIAIAVFGPCFAEPGYAAAQNAFNAVNGRGIYYEKPLVLTFNIICT